jgi:hypothetical protein
MLKFLVLEVGSEILIYKQITNILKYLSSINAEILSIFPLFLDSKELGIEKCNVRTISAAVTKVLKYDP